MGSLFAAEVFGAVLGPPIAGFFFDADGNYERAAIFAGVMICASLVRGARPSFLYPAPLLRGLRRCGIPVDRNQCMGRRGGCGAPA